MNTATDETPGFIVADWPAPAWVHACTSLRSGGCSDGPWASFNLGAHVGDEPQAVERNRALLGRALALPSPPQWLDQVHGCTVVEARAGAAPRVADGVWSAAPGVVCAVLTADCLPVLLCDRAGTVVAAVHCGWRGLAAGVLGTAVQCLPVPSGELLAWLGPAIGPRAFEVGQEVRDTFLARHDDTAVRAAFTPGDGHALRLHADLYALARAELARLGVRQVHGGGWCTHDSPELFYSYRRDGVCGRMASLVWVER